MDASEEITCPHCGHKFELRGTAKVSPEISANVYEKCPKCEKEFVRFKKK